MSNLPKPFFETPELAPEQWLKSRKGDGSSWVLIDVRSEGEFAEGHVPGAINCPLLNDHERHLVGLTYKKSGQQAAIELGKNLVWDSRRERSLAWLEKTSAFGPEKTILVSCWRGGLRSLLAASWIQETLVARSANEKFPRDIRVCRLSGGYKSARGRLLAAIETKHDMVILAGMTGSGKTALLHELRSMKGRFDPRRVIDLEALAGHRGSSFGHAVSHNGHREAQPSQQDFENALGLELLPEADGPLIIEDESTMIGRVAVPLVFRRQMRSAPVILVETPIAERSRAIHAEYVAQPLRAGCRPDALWHVLAENISALQRRLGGADTKSALQLLAAGRAAPEDFGTQEPWIRLLLEKYYDRAYTQSGQLDGRMVVFRGNVSQCRDFLLTHNGAEQL
jgi:tRNA 2-selenouridine synthase